MTHRPLPRRAQFPWASFLTVVSVTTLVIGVLSLSSWRTLRTIQGLETNELAIERVCGEIVHLDEVLTMSARMSAATGEARWQERYDEHVVLLDDAIARADSLAPVPEESEGSRQTKEANDRLVAMELEAFELVRNGDREGAARLLFSPAYEADKIVYAEGNDRYLASMRGRISQILGAERERAHVVRLLLATLVPLILILWVRVGRSIASNARARSLFESELERHAGELEAMNEEVRAASRVKGEFLARMSHEIRTPMNGVLGIAEILSKTELDEEQRDYVGTIVNSSNLLESILNDVLDFSRLEAGMLPIVPAACDVRAIARDVRLTFVARAKERDVELTAEVADDVPANVWLDPVRVRQVLLNLVGNAVKFTEDGEVRLSIETGRSEGYLRCTVRDSGIGIAPERLSSIFDGFVQEDDSIGRRFGGTGLGLTISRELTRAMGGTIDVESEVGVGTTFVVQLSAPETEAEEPAAALPRDAEPASSRAEDVTPRVLVVEDNAVNQLVARRLLEAAGCEVDVASNGEEGIARTRDADYDLVFMDVNMPVMDGLEATRAIRDAEGDGERLSIIALTASALPGDVDAAREAGMDDFVSKPVREGELARVLDRWLPRVRAAG